MLDDFMTRAALAGVGVAFASAPLGCFVVWRRMAYFGESTAHSAMLGIALSLALQLSIVLGAVLVSLVAAWTAAMLSGRTFAIDTLLGVVAHSALAFGLVAVSLLSGVRIDLMAYLLGDILAVSRGDLVVIWGGVFIVLVLLFWRWSALLLATLNEELAYSNGLNPRKEEVILILSLAITVAVAIKVVGVLLITAMLIIPPAAARNLSRTPESMVMIAVIVGSLSALGGLWTAYFLDTPAGPSIVCVASVFFVIFGLINFLNKKVS